MKLFSNFYGCFNVMQGVFTIKIYSFKNDYSEGVHPRILDALIEYNLVQTAGYGEDEFTEKAKSAIKQKMKKDASEIHFASGGTQANLLVISSILRPYESVIAADKSHINVHETGAIESVGHKINIVDTDNGKLDVCSIEKILDIHVDEHMVKPKLVYISNSTETGLVYTKTELQEISNCCRRRGLYLYIDGARIGSALCSSQNDLTLNDLSMLSDVFYIGGTKNGGMFGEAIVINNEELKDGFRYNMKQKGALLAKSRFLGIQFYELFKDNLYFEIAKHSNKMAEKISRALYEMGYKFLHKPVSNQLFPILPNDIINRISEIYDFYIWEKIDEKSSVLRIVTSWATDEKFADMFIDDLRRFA